MLPVRLLILGEKKQSRVLDFILTRHNTMETLCNETVVDVNGTDATRCESLKILFAIRVDLSSSLAPSGDYVNSVIFVRPFNYINIIFLNWLIVKNQCMKDLCHGKVHAPQ